jgi:hypothetical protein
MTPKRPRDPNQLAKSIIDIATGNTEAALESGGKVTPAMAAGVTDKLWEMDDLVAMLEQWELSNFKPEYQFVVRQYAIGKGRSVSVAGRGSRDDFRF